MEIRNTTPIHVIIAACFAALVLLCWSGIWMPCMYIAVVIMFLYMVLGARRNGKLDTTFLVYPLLCFAVLWIIAFHYAQVYSIMFHDMPPTFTIMGFHPSFFWIVVPYWLGGVATLAVGFYFLRDRYLTPEDWEAFKAKIAAIDAGTDSDDGEGR